MKKFKFYFWEKEIDIAKKKKKMVTFPEEIVNQYTYLDLSLLAGLKQVLATEILLKMIKNAFYSTLKAFFVLKLYKFMSCLFGCV